MDNPKLIIMAAVMAGSNMGMPLPERSTMRKARFARDIEKWKLSTAVMHFWQDRMENEEHMRMFMDEADGWFKDLSKMSDEDFAKSFPSAAKTWTGTRPIRYEQALQIIDGAGNPFPITAALQHAVRECYDEGFGTEQIWKDPAIRIMVHQIAHLTDQYDMNNTITEFSNVLYLCRSKSREFANG